jgi:SnoaL-like domain
VSAPADSPSKLPLRAAMEAGDVDAVLDAFAPSAILRSPFTARLTFRGSAQIRAVIEVILESFADLRYTDEIRGERSAVLVASARVGGKEIELVDHMRLDENGKIVELTVFFRPLPAMATAMRVIGSGLGRRRSATRGQAVSLLTQPLGAMTELGDRAGVRLVGPAL